jgi:hypothetical protein
VDACSIYLARDEFAADSRIYVPPEMRRQTRWSRNMAGVVMSVARGSKDALSETSHCGTMPVSRSKGDVLVADVK